VSVSGLTGGVTAIAGGGFHGLALKNGGVWAWGYNYYGQLGDGTRIQRSTLAPVSGLTTGVTVIAGGMYQSLAAR
jgi:alpha-tubulin suppressor-like RCC1 family protein